MTDDLGRDVSGGVDLHAHRGHLEWAPVAMLDEVLDQAWGCVIVALVLGCRHTRHIGDQVLRFRRHPHQIDQFGHKEGCIIPSNYITRSVFNEHDVGFSGINVIS